MFGFLNKRRHDISRSGGSAFLGREIPSKSPAIPNRNERLQRIEKYLKHRGCPHRIAFSKTEPEIRWLG